MRTFSNITRVRIKPGITESESGKDLTLIAGQTAIIKRVRRGDDGAWFQLEGDLPEKLRAFGKGDEGGRENHILLYPEECTPA